VLYPYGQPVAPEQRACCDSFVWGLGGDYQRVIDAPTSNLDRFGAHVRRFQTALTVSDAPAIVVFTRANPLGLAVINARRKLELLLPALQNASWVLFVDPVCDPFFMDSVRKFGTLVDRPPDSIEWTTAAGASFLIAKPVRLIEQHARDLEGERFVEPTIS